MGCDGGSIPGRRDLVKKRKSTKADDNVVAETSVARWRICAISQNRLQAPVVICRLGMLYNKDSLIQYLISKAHVDKFAHIRSLKDVFEVKFTLAPEASSTDELADKDVFCCPITTLPGNGKYRFLFSKACGCVLSERALKEVPSASCLSCHADLPASIDSERATEEHFIIVNPNQEEQDRLRAKLPAAPGKSSKRKKRDHKQQTDKPENGVKKANEVLPISDACASIFTSHKLEPKITNTLFGNV